MKKFKTSKDLNELSISIPLNTARNILTISYRGAEDALRVLLKADQLDFKFGKLQREALEAYVEDYKFLRDTIADTIRDNVSFEDQTVIKAEEDAFRDELHKDLAVKNSSRIDEAHACSDPDCDTCEPIREIFSKKSAENVKSEFELDDLPEGSIIVPGSKEEN